VRLVLLELTGAPGAVLRHEGSLSAAPTTPGRQRWAPMLGSASRSASGTRSVGKDEVSGEKGASITEEVLLRRPTQLQFVLPGPSNARRAQLDAEVSTGSGTGSMI
jgi:hypothetical protein